MCDEFVLDNGLRVIAEYIPHFPSVSVGLWIGAGSMYETEAENGLSHFVEHMLFKSTHRRTTKEIAVEMDAIGGQVNAFTSKECTCYYAKVIAEHLPRAVDLLSDLLLGAKLESEEFEKERGVILEEIAMGEDTPEDLVYDLLAEAYFGDHPLSRPILGTHEQIASVSRQALVEFRRKHYRPDNTVLAVAGKYDLATLRELANRYLGAWQAEKADTDQVEPGVCCERVITKKKDIEQVHVCLAYPGVSQDDEDLYPMSVMNNLFGGGMSSRLFQRIREELGLAYSVGCSSTPYMTEGMFEVDAAVSPKNEEAAISELVKQLCILRRDGVTMQEFIRAKEQLKASVVMGLEGNSAVAAHMGRSELLYGKIKSEDDVLASIESVTLEQVNEAARHFINFDNYSLCAVGKIRNASIYDGVVRSAVL